MSKGTDVNPDKEQLTIVPSHMQGFGQNCSWKHWPANWVCFPSVPATINQVIASTIYTYYVFIFYSGKYVLSPLQKNLSGGVPAIRFFAILGGPSHLTPDVSTVGCRIKYSATYFRLQSQTHGFLAKCL
jgi:hypothetical protein